MCWGEEAEQDVGENQSNRKKELKQFFPDRVLDTIFDTIK
jgi:hypothetical protein